MSSCNELADYDWLTGPAAGELMRDLADGSEPLHVAATRLRRDHSAARVHLVLEQVELRQRAAAKFPRANAMYFTQLGLEQATDAWIAAYKASRFFSHSPVADLCCGIGGDLLALGEVGRTTGVDRDPIAACLALANARSLGVDVTVQTRDIAELSIGDIGAWHLDPDRRPAGHRTSSLEWSSPGLDAIERLLAVVPHSAVKLAPAADVLDHWQADCELEWISRDRECRQLVAWHGDLAMARGRRRATLLSNDGRSVRTVVGQPEVAIPFVERPNRFVFEPDPSVLAARLTGAIAAEHNLSAFSAGIAYLTGPAAIDDAALACFEIDEVLPLKPQLLAEHLRERNIGRVEIKKRGVDHDPEMVRKQLRLRGDDAATLLLTKLDGKHVAILARRFERDADVSSLLPTS